jgi:ABC-type Fe3+-hydroxamate transport system substrate-binding protein
MIKIFDDRQRRLYFARPPRRIVSLVPSDTESLFALGLGSRVVGRTQYCVEPAGAVDPIPTCGGTKSVDVEAVAALEPELVMCNQEENTRAAVDALIARKLNVFIAFPQRVLEAVAHLGRLARIAGVADQPAVAALIRRGYRVVRDAEACAAGPRVRVFVPVWLDPLMTFSSATFASDLLALCGADNVFADRARRYPLAADLREAAAAEVRAAADRDTRYPRVSRAEVERQAPALILLPDEPYAFGEVERSDALSWDTPASRTGAVRLCDGKDLFWYGARTVDAIPRLRAVVGAA